MIGNDNGFPSIMPSRRTLALLVIIAAALVVQDGNAVAAFKTKTLLSKRTDGDSYNSMRKEIPPTSS